jgi:NarL family two-component system response regulator LiaR
MAEAVRKAAAGEPVLHPRVASRLVDALRNRPPRSQDALATLSQREREVLNLLAQGLSNSVIAEQLAIGEKTVKSHVSNILGKLHVADRTQAAVYAWRRGVVRD